MVSKVAALGLEEAAEKFSTGSRKEIFYNGYFYDVTDFVGRHPGGGVINFYTEKGEDATQAFEQFHFRAKDKVNSILKGFKKRKAEFNERNVEQKPSRHEALTADFKKLFEELQVEGYFIPSYREVCLRLLECISLTLLGYGVILQSNTVATKLLTAPLLGFAFSRSAYLQHEAGHRSVTGNRKVDGMIQNFLTCFILGNSSSWWNSQHNRHHAMPQRLEHDVDLATLPFVAFHRRAAKDKKEINRFFVKYQAIFYWTLDLFLIVFAWKFVLHPRHQLKKKAYGEILLTIPSFYIMFHMGSLYYFLAMYWFAFILSLNLSVSHTHLDVADKPTHWVEYALTHTANLSSNIFVDYWMGYLNYQIEHHLFPTMPEFRQMQISSRVQALAKKYGLPYRILTFPQGCYVVLKNLNDVAKDLTN